jgi:hypothetical protein
MAGVRHRRLPHPAPSLHNRTPRGPGPEASHRETLGENIVSCFSAVVTSLLLTASPLTRECRILVTGSPSSGPFPRQDGCRPVSPALSEGRPGAQAERGDTVGSLIAPPVLSPTPLPLSHRQSRFCRNVTTALWERCHGTMDCTSFPRAVPALSGILMFVFGENSARVL